MSIREVTMYRIVCNYPDCGASPDDEYYAWIDAESAEVVASENSDWLIVDRGHHYCMKHTVYDEDKDDYVPMPDPAGGTS